MPITNVFIPRVFVQEIVNAFYIPTIAPVSYPSGTTSETIDLPALVGGVAPFTYEALIAYDSLDLYEAYIVSLSSSSLELNGFTDNQFLRIILTVTDSEGSTATQNIAVVIGDSASTPMLPGTFPDTILLDPGITSTSVLFNSVTGTYVDPVTYTASITDGSGTVSNTELEASVSGLVPGTASLLRMRAVDSSTPNLIADAYCLIDTQSLADPLAWTTIRTIDFKNQGSITFVNGSQSVSLYDSVSDSNITCTLTHTMGSGSFSSVTSTLSALYGWKTTWIATSSGTYLRGGLQIPLGFAMGIDDEIRITIKGIIKNVVTNNSFYWQVDNSTSNVETATNSAGFRLLQTSGSNTAFYNRAGSNVSSALTTTTTPSCPAIWQDGSTELTQTLTWPRRGTRPYQVVSGGGSTISADLGHIGRSPSPSSTRGGFIGGMNFINLQFHGSNGSANGGGNQYSCLHSITIQRRSLP